MRYLYQIQPVLYITYIRSSWCYIHVTCIRSSWSYMLPIAGPPGATVQYMLPVAGPPGAMRYLYQVQQNTLTHHMVPVILPVILTAILL